MFAMEDRIGVLYNMLERSPSEQKELDGLLRASNFREQYNPIAFTPEHKSFKAAHNRAFAVMARYATAESGKGGNIFYLDGPDAGTTKMLVQENGGNDAFLERCYTANRHQSTCDALRGEHGLTNVIVSDVVAAFANELAHVRFAAYYLDGCGGFSPAILAMMQACVSAPSVRNSQHRRMVIGYSLVGDTRRLLSNTMQVTQGLVQLVKHSHSVHHVMDDPAAYGVDPSLAPMEGNVATLWFVLEPRFD